MNRDPLPQTPALERLLARLARRITLHVWLHGLGTVVTAGVLWLLFAFFADYVLRVPPAVRVLHGAAFLGVLGFFLWRDLLRPLRRLPDRAGLAVLLERPHPQLRQLLVSAAQFQTRGQGQEVSEELVAAVLAEADARAAELNTDGVLDERSPRLRFGAGGLSLGLLTALGLAQPAMARIFVDHLLGRSTPWPQRTHLTVEIPLHDESARVDVTPERIHVRVARGTDVPVLVRAEGVVPSEVMLHFEGGAGRILSPSGGGVFRTLLGSRQEDMTFYATGGDDDDGLPRVDIEVLQPPDVESVAVAVEPPPWTGLAPSVEFNRDVEVVAGSKLRIHVLPTPRDARGTARLLPEDASLALEPAPFPPQGDDNVTQETGLVFELTAATSLGYRFELLDATGLANPDPGLFRIQVIEDRAPEVRMLAPGRSEFDTVVGGVVPIRARAEDDFGLTAMSWSVRAMTSGEAEEGPPLAGGAFTPIPLGDGDTPVPGDPSARLAWLGAARLELDSLAGDAQELTLDQRFELVVQASDNHQPQAADGRSAPVRLRVISADELLRRMQDRLGRARLDTNRLGELQREKQLRVTELVDSIDPEGQLTDGDSLALHAAAIGQRRVESDATTLSRDLALVAQDMLYSRLDDKAGALLEALDTRQRTLTDSAFHPEVWQEVTDAFGRGELGAPGFTGNLIKLVDQSLAISAEAAREASLALDRAQKASSAAGVATALQEAYEHQAESLRRIEVLLASLAEWDNFQNVLQLTRDILNRSKALRDRTRRAAKE